MDDIVKVLVIMAAFALPLIRQIKKSKIFIKDAETVSYTHLTLPTNREV